MVAKILILALLAIAGLIVYETLKLAFEPLPGR